MVIDRSEAWKRARRRKDGGYDEKVQEIVDKIVSYSFKANIIVFTFY